MDSAFAGIPSDARASFAFWRNSSSQCSNDLHQLWAGRVQWTRKGCSTHLSSTTKIWSRPFTVHNHFTTFSAVRALMLPHRLLITARVSECCKEQCDSRFSYRCVLSFATCTHRTCTSHYQHGCKHICNSNFEHHAFVSVNHLHVAVLVHRAMHASKMYKILWAPIPWNSRLCGLMNCEHMWEISDHLRKSRLLQDDPVWSNSAAWWLASGRDSR